MIGYMGLQRYLYDPYLGTCLYHVIRGGGEENARDVYKGVNIEVWFKQL